MQLDKTGIAIRERGLLEQMDLALKVTRRHIGPLVLAWLAGVVPFAVLNYLLLRRAMPAELSEGELPWGYVYLLFVLIGWQTPLATSFVTLYLSRALFLERPTLGQLLRAFASRLWQLFWVQVVLRGLIAFWVIYAFEIDASEGSRSLWGVFLILGWAIPYLFYPFTNEILLLEGNSLLRRGAGVSTVGRTLNMHGYATGDMIGRWFVLIVIGPLLVVSLYVALASLRVALSLGESLDPSVVTVLLPLSVWMVIGYLAVVRFLGYLDLRIRIEGWEVELLMRAEGSRLTRQIA